MLITKSSVIGPLIVFVLFIFYLSIQILYFGPRAPTSPDESQALFFSKLLSEQHTLVYKNPLNQQFQEKIFASRQYVQRGDKTSPSAFLGYIILLSLFRSVSESFLYLSGPLLATICLIYLYRLSKIIFNNHTAIITCVLLGFLPVFTYWTLSFFNNISEVAFLVGGIYYLIKSVRENSSSSYILTAIFFSVSIWIRYTNILLIPLFLIPYCVVNKDRLNKKNIFYGLLILTLFLIPLFISNYQLYGSPFTIGQNSKDQLVYELISSNIPLEKLPFVPFRSFSILFANIKDYVIWFIPLIFFGFLLGITYLIKKRKSKGELILLISICIVWGFYYLGGFFFGYGLEPNVNSSYARYLLIVYIILVAFFSYFVVQLKNQNLKLAIIVISILSFITLSTNSSTSLVTLKSQITGSNEYLTKIKSHTPANSIFFVKGADKIIFPARNTALYVMLSKNEKNADVGVEKTLSLMSSVIKKDYPVYILREDDFYSKYSLNLYLAKLSQYHLKVENYDPSLYLYKINST